MTGRSEQRKLGVVLFILGLTVGGAISFFLAAALSARRVSQYEVITAKLRQQNKRLVDSLPEETLKNISGADHCVCCGDLVPEGNMVCLNCLREKM